MNANPPEFPIQSDLGRLLRGVARELRAMRLHKRGLRRWLVVAVAAFGVFQLKANVPALEPYYFPLLGLLLALGIGRSVMVAMADKLDFAEAARVVEEAFPDLKQALRTAAEQRPTDAGRFNYLQMRVIGNVLKHANINDWRKQPKNRARWTFAGHAVALAAALTLTLGPALLRLANQNFALPVLTLPRYGVTVTPGDKEVERGSIVVVAARFDGRIPREAQLVWRTPDGKTGTAGMAKSLSDPIFAFTLPVVNNDTTYSINYLGKSTDQFTLKVFDQPALTKADATLDYPDYTGQAKKTIPNTHRISAITGTKLDYAFTMNKPMKDVTLTDDEGKAVTITASNAERTQFALSMTIDKTVHLTMHLTDNEGRPNPAPTTFSITATENRRPTVQVTFPVRDQRVSPIEEVHITATARDQFGLLDYGLAYSVGEGDPQYLSLHPADAAKAPQATFSDVLKLETKNVEPGTLVTWFAWADDYGPDGKVRRTTSDLAYAEVRPFETIFQEDDTAGAQAQQQQQQRQQQQQQQNSSNPLQDLIQQQRQISTATWNLKQQDKPSSTFSDDIKTLMDSQNDAIGQLGDLAQAATTPQQQAAAADAAKFMKQAETGLTTSSQKTSLDPLTDAWSGAQGAYQSLLRMQNRNFRVTQTRGQAGQQGQQRSQMQDQLSQLQFRQQQNRYQTQNQAQDPATDQQRNQMEAQSRLADLARRQQDLNQRLQDLQSALAATQDQQQRDELQRELQRLQDEQRSMLDELDQARQNIDQMQAGQQADQARQQLDQARQNMQQSIDQLAQNQASQALAAGTRADQNLQQTTQNLRRDTANQFSQQMETARQQARDLATTQQNNGQQLNQLAQNSAQTLDDSAQRQALAQSYQQQAQNLNKLMDELKQITVDSEETEPGLHQQLYDLLRQQSQTNLAETLQNSAQMLRSGFTDQARPLQDSAAQNLDKLRQGIEHAAQSVLGDDTAAARFAQNELTDLTQQMMREQAATSDQFRDAGQQPSNQGQNGQQPGDNPTAANQNSNGQQGANGQGQNADQTSDQFAQGNSQGQQGQGRQGQGQGQTQNQGQGQQGTGGQNGDQSSQQFAQGNGQGQQGQGPQGQQGQGSGQSQQPGARGQGQAGRGQGNNPTDQLAQDGQPANGQGQGRQGQARGQGQGRQGQGARGQGQGARGQGGNPGDQLAQDGQPANGQGQGRAQGRQGQGARGQGQGGRGPGQPNGQDGTQPGDANAGQLAQSDDTAVDQPFDAQPGNGGQRGNRAGRGGQRGNGQGRAGNGGANATLAQNNDPANPGGARNGGNFNNGGNFRNGNNVNNGGNVGGAFTSDTYNDNGPITGANFADWANRLRTVQNLLDDPQQRQQVANALAQAQDLRRNYLRDTSQMPKWDTVMSNVIAPLNQVSTALHQQLLRQEQPNSLQPVDQDPVPEKFANSVKSYYEALGN